MKLRHFSETQANNSAVALSCPVVLVVLPQSAIQPHSFSYVFVAICVGVRGYLFVCMCACVCVCSHLCGYTQKPKKVLHPPQHPSLKEGCELPSLCGCWEPNLDPLKKQ